MVIARRQRNTTEVRLRALSTHFYQSCLKRATSCAERVASGSSEHANAEIR
jgi:hypothetical protein